MTRQGKSGPDTVFLTAACLFFLSGFSALLCQVIWQRVLGLFSGVDVYSVTIIVSAFMLGMGVGSIAGGYLADRLSRNRLIAMFAFAELMIAVSALCSKWLYYDVLYQGFPGLGATPWLLAIVLFFSLLVPTFFMGITLPMLSRAMVLHHAEASFKVGFLYALNTLGAACGSLLTGIFLVRHHGFEAALRVGACLNLLAMAGAFGLYVFLHRRNGSSDTHADDAATAITTPATAVQPHQLSLQGWLLVYAYSGFIALALEIVWFRVLGVMLKSTAFTFGILLGLYLAGLALGALAGLFFAPRSRRPITGFLVLQACITLYAALSLSAFVHAVDTLPALSAIWQYLGQPGNLAMPFRLADITPEFRAMYLLVAPLLILPPTLLMGASFPFLQAAVQNDLAFLGRRVGWLQTANILGATAGSIIAGLFLLAFLETPGTLKLLTLMGVLYWLLLVKLQVAGRAQRLLACAASLLVTVAAASAIPDARTFWATLHGAAPGAVVYAEDNTGLSVVRSYSGDFGDPAGKDGSAYLFINGAAQSNIPFGGPHTALGLVATMIHPAPREIAIIGLGSGDTIFSAGSRPVTESITSIEILAAQAPNLREVHRLRPYAGLEKLFADPRFGFVFSDGRTWLMRSDRRFDIIEADALRPNMAYAGNLYSVEYFSLLRDRLKPGGFAVSWIPTGRTAQTFRSVFPYTLNIGHWMYIGSNQPIVLDREAALARVREAGVREYFAGTGIDPERILLEELDKYVDQPQERIADAQETNTDLFPKDEYEKP